MLIVSWHLPSFSCSRGNQCVNCSQPFIHSSVSFEILPLVEFQLQDGITDQEALRLIETDVKPDEQAAEEENVMRMEENMGEDPFTTKLLTFQQDGIDFSPVVASRALLQSLLPGEVWYLRFHFQCCETS